MFFRLGFIDSLEWCAFHRSRNAFVVCSSRFLLLQELSNSGDHRLALRCRFAANGRFVNIDWCGFDGSFLGHTIFLLLRRNRHFALRGDRFLSDRVSRESLFCYRNTIFLNLNESSNRLSGRSGGEERNTVIDGLQGPNLVRILFRSRSVFGFLIPVNVTTPALEDRVARGQGIEGCNHHSHQQCKVEHTKNSGVSGSALFVS
mmetsp:Transcript_1395/g.3215  ORF Transcript_1395/g.3215 Transcript_1395/m.3215 type:complete len:203 (+) Transcript_1395:855-1463(+)